MPVHGQGLALAGLFSCLLAAPVTADPAAAPAGRAVAAPAPPAPAPTAMRWPDTPVARHARAWFDAFNDGEAATRALYQEHYSPAALASRPVEQRLDQYREMRTREGTLTPLSIPELNEDGIQVAARAADGHMLTLTFECEPDPPHGIRGIRIMAGEGPRGPEGPQVLKAAAGPRIGDEEAVQAMRAILARAAEVDSFSGAVLLARDEKPLLRQAWGLAERRFAVPNRPETRFNLGSINKLFTKVAIAQLAEQGRLSLDDPLTRWLPDWPGPSASKITIAMLAAHRAGIGDFFGARYQAADRSQLRHNRDYLPLFRDEPLGFEPGTAERYSNGSYVVLGEIIAKASGEDYYDYVRGHVWTPAGMSATGCFEADDLTPDLAMGYTRGEDARAALRENVFTRPARGSAAGGGYSTLDDMLRFDQALVAHRLCGAEWTAWVVGGPAPGRVRAASAPAGERPGFAFAGGAPGISAEYGREGSLTLIVLANFDPPWTQATVAKLRGVLRRMKD